VLAGLGAAQVGIRDGAGLVGVILAVALGVAMQALERSISASDARNSLPNTVWKRLKFATATGPQASAASVSSCWTAETCTAEISAAEAQLVRRACAWAAVAAIRLRAATQAPSFMHFMKNLFDRRYCANEPRREP
jgi:hypothetical protein